MPNSLGKSRRLRSRKAIGKLFLEGEVLKAFPVKLIYRLGVGSENGSAVQVAVSAPKRNLRKAVDRNRTKRLMREAIRHRMDELEALQVNVQMMFIFLGKAVPSQPEMDVKIGTVIEKFKKELIDQKNEVK